jgi:arylsulfatase A-like enzyme
MKHLLVICIDCLRADSFGQLLALDGSRIAEALGGGVNLPWAYSAAPWTYPSTHSILTGLLPSRHGARHRGAYRQGVDAPWPAPFDGSQPTLFQVLGGLGYATFGISTIYWALNERCRYPGWDVVVRSAEQNVFYRCTPASWVVDEFIGLYDSRLAGHSFAGYLHLMDLHRPYRMESAAEFLPKGFRPPIGIEDWNVRPPHASGPGNRRFQRAKRTVYEALLRYVDTEIGRLLNFLDLQGIYEETTMVLVGDHGEEFWEHYDFEMAHYDCGKKSSKDWLMGTGHGHTMFDEILHVPLAILNPPQSLPSEVINSPVSTLDLFPTVLEWVGLEPRTAVDGKSLLRPVPGRCLQAEATLYGFERKALISGSLKCIASPGDNHLAVFDRTEDPLETRPLPVSVCPNLTERLLACFTPEELP